MYLYVVRHGETQANAEGRYLGALDTGLTACGINQVEALKSRLPAHIDAVVVSPLRRAQQTAQIIFDNSSLSLRAMHAFRERHVGVFEGLTQTEARARYPELWSQNITRQWNLAPTGGESIAAVFIRVQRGLCDLLADYPQQVVVLVAHGFIAKTIRALVRRDFSDFFDWQLENGAVLSLQLTDNFGIDYDVRALLAVRF
ncbi:histidine phosphatase family protein [Candidatus Methylospira mobilis]|uniref:Histidine phosphatase family protein n=1 Tax=Candidatus Methylospira mobilis TaxID=1808979 RepID=A0A5Q0BFX7_9GAMM|nr:histidine phosphatase family protein [Candidatus Methylospira mobilis]QFY42720.1 histidine phosphatase family protein [Candidatus Methylospira mobilis]WNV04154.1 histidine phosphatase family protein [Candidatus Methylospira mobilis]